VPLRSVEAATRDDAIAAAREQFGPSARVVGVRRVRSGGVLGFFATERYVAEVAPEQSGRPAVPVPATARSADAQPSERFSSPLASAAPAQARATAPARNGAAAWAAEAARPSAPSATTRSATTRSAAPAWSAGAVRPAAAPQPGAQVDADRVSELAGLLAAQPVGPSTPAYTRATFPRAAFPRAARDEPTSLHDDEDQDDESTSVRDEPPILSAPASPFTAALARMVAGDRDVRQAVQEALERPAETPSRGDAEPWPTWPGPIGTAGSSVSSRAARQEEETVGDQVIAPPSTITAPAVEVPTWAAEPEAPASSVSSREEAIAEILRAALAQGHSDEALAGILRKVLAGASPQTALTEPEVPAVAVPEVVLQDVDLQDVDLEDVAEVLEVAQVIPEAAPVPERAPVAVLAAAPAAPVVAAGPAASIWGTTASQAPLWGEAVAAASAPVVTADAPIWAEVVLQEPAPVAETVEPAPVATLAETTTETTTEQTGTVAVEDPTATHVEAPAVEESVEEYLAEAEIEEMAPILARTASDPAPMMSLDSTTVMPPLSLLPPLPSSRGRGRPPVPPTSSRPPVSPAASTAPAGSAGRPPATTPPGDTPPTGTPSADTPPAGTSSAGTSSADMSSADTPVTPSVPASPAAPAPSLRLLATVTRLPVAPLMATPQTPDMHEEVSEREEPVAPVASEPDPVRPVGAPVTPAVIAPDDIAVRLEALGLPGRLLGTAFADDVAVHGTYAALTRALGLRLPQAPELPNGAGEVLFVVGPGVETLRAARSLAASLRLDPDRVQWATRGDLAGLAPEGSRMTTIDAAIGRRQDAAVAGTVTIVAVDAPLRTDAYWMAQMLAIWSPAAVWAVVDATRKPEDLESWIDGLARVDALIVQDTDLSADPAAVLRRVAIPVALLDGVRATPHRWASLLCERLESAKA
jgi:hypothetical protein